MTWPSSYSPDTVNLDAPEWQSDGVSVNAISGALDAAIPLPSYNPNVARAGPDLRLAGGRPPADHHRREPAERLGLGAVAGQRHPDVQRHGGHDVLLRHQHASTRATSSRSRSRPMPAP